MLWQTRTSLLCEVAAAAHTQLFPEAPGPGSRRCRREAMGLLGALKTSEPQVGSWPEAGENTKAVFHPEIRWTDRWAEGHM